MLYWDNKPFGENVNKSGEQGFETSEDIAIDVSKWVHNNSHGGYWI
jgi:hypothetical protein